jgi:hypothetical protein
MCFVCLNACCFINQSGCYISPKFVNRKSGALQFGIRAKVSTLSLDGPVERSLDQECEGNWVWKANFGPWFALKCQGVT